MKPPSRLLAVALSLGAFAASAFSAEPPRLKRAGSFLGIHFDFHAGPDCTEVGKNTTPAMVQRIIDLVHPDDRSATLEEYQRQIKTGFTVDFENRCLCKDGSWRWLSWRIPTHVWR